MLRNRRHLITSIAFLLPLTILLNPGPARGETITTTLNASFQDTVFASYTTQPEWVTVSGTVHVVTEVQIPPNPIDEPFEVTVHLNLSNASGVGQTSGQTYRANGAATVDGTSELPDTFVAPWSYRLIPPNPIIPGNPIRLIPGNPVRTLQPLTVTMALGTDGTASDADATPSLVGWWRGEGNAEDSVGESNGTLVGDVTYVTGLSGQAFHFDGASFVEVPSAPALEPQALTVVLWMRSPAEQPLIYLLSKGAYGCNEASSYALYTQGDLYFYVSNGPASTYSPSPPATTNVWDGDWHHVAGTFDGTTVRLFVDGVEQGTGNPANLTEIDYALPDNTTYRIGGYSSSCVDFDFDGDIDDVQIFSRALSASEIQAIHASAQ